MAVAQGKKQGVVVKAKTPAPDVISKIRNPSNVGGYGMSYYSGPTSADPGQRVLSPLAQNLESSVDDDAIDIVRSRGLDNGHGENVADTYNTLPQAASTSGGFDGGAANDSQLRDMAQGGKGKTARCAVHPSMAPPSGSPSGKVGSGDDWSSQKPTVRKPV